MPTLALLERIACGAFHDVDASSTGDDKRYFNSLPRSRLGRVAAINRISIADLAMCQGLRLGAADHRSLLLVADIPDACLKLLTELA